MTVQKTEGVLFRPSLIFERSCNLSGASVKNWKDPTSVRTTENLVDLQDLK